MYTLSDSQLLLAHGNPNKKYKNKQVIGVILINLLIPVFLIHVNVPKTRNLVTYFKF